MAVDSSDLTMVPQTTIPLTDAEGAKKVLRLIDGLDEHDDVQNVHANFDIPDDILESVEA
jgi:transcriptional/translational regulatory protein YebC/TACO1